eukprot:8767999-Pyramimonas_sp.AAC.1
MADGAYRHAEHLHEQAVAAAIRLQANIEAARTMGAAAALRLAEAKEAKAAATGSRARRRCPRCSSSGCRWREAREEDRAHVQAGLGRG